MVLRPGALAGRKYAQILYCSYLVPIQRIFTYFTDMPTQVSLQTASAPALLKLTFKITIKDI